MGCWALPGEVGSEVIVVGLVEPQSDPRGNRPSAASHKWDPKAGLALRSRSSAPRRSVQSCGVPKRPCDRIGCRIPIPGNAVSDRLEGAPGHTSFRRSQRNQNEVWGHIDGQNHSKKLSPRPSQPIGQEDRNEGSSRPRRPDGHAGQDQQPAVRCRFGSVTMSMREIPRRRSRSASMVP